MRRDDVTSFPILLPNNYGMLVLPYFTCLGNMCSIDKSDQKTTKM